MRFVNDLPANRIVIAFTVDEGTQNFKDGWRTKICLDGGHVCLSQIEYAAFMRQWKEAVALDYSETKTLEHREAGLRATVARLQDEVQRLVDTKESLSHTTLERSVKAWCETGGQYPRKALKDEWMRLIAGDNL